MVEITAVIRPNRASATKKVLADIGYPGFTCCKVVGRGKKPVHNVLQDGSVIETKFVSKRLFIIIVSLKEKDAVIKAIMDANSYGNCGDGKIFVSAVGVSYNVRTGKKL